MVATVRLNTNLITDWASFHFACQEAFGFPEYYGENMNAWIDCMSAGLSRDDEMNKFDLKKGERLFIEIPNFEEFNLRLPEIAKELVECTDIVNNRYIKRDGKPKIALLFF